jgi:succinate-semialdehyde dehydrogenase/glutarate-semialdehyde dehydrogenase
MSDSSVQNGWNLDFERVRPGVLPGSAGFGPPLLPIVEGQAGEGRGELLPCVNPSNGEPFAHVACADAAEIDRAVESAAFAARLWRAAPVDERARSLERLSRAVRSAADEIAGLIALEQGKPFLEALTLEVLPALDHLRFLSGHARDLLRGEAVEPRHPFWAHKDALYLYEPLGVVALVTSSSLPFAQPLVQTAAALAMGNAVVLKPSSLAPMCGLRVGQLIADAGFPAGIVNVVPASHEDALRLVSHPKVDKVFVTGTLEAGQNVMVTAGCAPRPVVLSLGGKHPSVVAADADVGRAARGIAWGALANAGQNCGAVERVYVDERIAANFVARLMDAVDKVRIDDSLSGEADMGPLVSATRLESVHAQVEEAVAGGGRILRGGVISDRPGFFYPPTIVLNPPPDCRLLREETMGPVIPVVVVENLEQAIQLSNDSDFALSASGWTSSDEIALRLSSGLQAGVVTINDVLYAYDEPAASWSGFRGSGLGAVHGRAGLMEMSRKRFVSFDRDIAEAPLHAFPYDEQGLRLARAADAALHADTRLRRTIGLLRLLRIRRFRERVPWKSFLLGKKRQKP